ncbi:DNA internalization-related competence protein ComEC/Rec2 [bacterium]|nr:DNA internalization-related competence protein ComEC/Rec2 [bacterium]
MKPWLSLLITVTLIASSLIPNFYLYVTILILGTIWLKNNKVLTHFYIFLLLISIVFTLSLKHHISSRNATINNFPSNPNQQFTGIITYVNKTKLTLKLDNNFTLTIFIPKKHNLTLNVNDIIQVSGNYIQPSISRNPGQNNAKRYCMMHKKLGVMYANKISILKSHHTYSFHSICAKLKQHIVHQHQKSLPQPHATLYTALIFGESYAELPQDLKKTFKKAGLIHALVVSGSQVSLIIGVLTLLLNRIWVYRHYQFIVIIPICIVFYTLTGGGESVSRAMIMALIALFIKHCLRYKTSPLYIINLTALIMIIYDPFIIYKAGAILSFLATFSLIYGIEFIEKKCPSTWPASIKTLLAGCLAPWLFTTPTLLLYFNQLPLASLISNILLVTLIEYIVILGFASTCLGFIYFPLALILNQVAYLGISIILWVSKTSTLLPFAVINTSTPIITSFALVSISIIILKSSLSRSKKSAVIITFLFMILAIPPLLKRNRLDICFLDVGQGDAALIQYNNTTILIDTGPKFDRYLGGIANNVLIPALNHYGINSLDYLIISHFDKDHSANLEAISKHIPIKTIIHNGNLNTYLKKQNITLDPSTKHLSLCNNQTLTIKDLNLHFLNPCSYPEEISKNNQSLVFQVQKNEHNILFTGDIEEETEYTLLETVPQKLKTSILKVAHHGSKTSSTDLFLKTSNPKHIIISSGQHNRYHHPHPSILQRLSLYPNLFRTDLQGAVMVVIKKHLTISPFLQN